ncbi:MAG: hypothetical protein D6696_06035 [Acidobacteria bacterium]|nr:MAG: hypothetical protein D6696_06035 [Acidobacteriota bacterium]
MLASLLLLGGSAVAEMCTIDSVPAATLLLPNFKVDIGDADGNGTPDCAEGGINTLFSVNNASAAPALAHITLWTDWSLPTIDFDVYLTGYDIQTINLCDIIAFGNLPVTAHPTGDPADTISPHQYAVPGGSDNPAWDPAGAFSPSCDPVLPFTNPAVTSAARNRVANGHAGYPISGSNCLGEQLNGAGSCDTSSSPVSCPAGTIARGYVTVDSVNECSTLFPNDNAYYTGTPSVINNNNVLWGDYFKLDPVNAFAQGEPLVHIEAQDGFIGGVTNYTFYGRYTEDIGFIDNREPLGTTWGARYLNGGPFTGGTKLTVWRDSTVDPTVAEVNSGLACGLCATGSGAGPSWCPLNETQVVCFNEAESVVTICFAGPGGVISPPDPGSDAACFPLETNHLDFGVGDLQVPFNFGWCYLNLNLPAGHPGFPFGGPVSGPTLAQSYVAVTHSALGEFSVGLQAIELSNACQDVNPVVMGDLPEFSP